MSILLTLRINSELDAFGKPILPKAQARPRFGRFGSVRSPKTGWYHLVLWEGMKAAPKIPLDGPLGLDVVFIFPRPKAAGKLQFYKWTKPDLDNLVKAIKDALTKAGWWVDDGRVAGCSTVKRYAVDGEMPGAVITVARLADAYWAKREARA